MFLSGVYRYDCASTCKQLLSLKFSNYKIGRDFFLFFFISNYKSTLMLFFTSYLNYLFFQYFFYITSIFNYKTLYGKELNIFNDPTMICRLRRNS